MKKDNGVTLKEFVEIIKKLLQELLGNVGHFLITEDKDGLLINTDNDVIRITPKGEILKNEKKFNMSSYQVAGIPELWESVFDEIKERGRVDSVLSPEDFERMIRDGVDQEKPNGSIIDQNGHYKYGNYDINNNSGIVITGPYTGDVTNVVNGYIQNSKPGHQNTNTTPNIENGNQNTEIVHDRRLFVDEYGNSIICDNTVINNRGNIVVGLGHNEFVDSIRCGGPNYPQPYEHPNPDEIKEIIRGDYKQQTGQKVQE